MELNAANILELAKQLNAMGEKVTVDQNDIKAYFPSFNENMSIRDFYIPRPPVKAYNNMLEGLRKVSTPNFDYLIHLITPAMRIRR